MEGVCYDCGREFKSIEVHWGRSSCEVEPLLDERKQIITGILLGDGHATKDGELYINHTNESYLQYIDDILGKWCLQVKKVRSGEEQKEMSLNNGFDNRTNATYSDVYRLRTRKHPFIENIRENWYGGSDGKSFPDTVELTPTSAKHLYVCDGTLRHRENSNRRESVEISSKIGVNKLSNMLEQHEFSPSVSTKYHRLELGVDDTKDFFYWIGEPVKGFKYKWPKVDNR